MKALIFFIVFAFSFTFPQDTVQKESANQDSLVIYVWDGMKIISGLRATMKVPPGFEESDNFYGEGVVTTLLYKDSSCILLHFGWAIKTPFFSEDKENELIITDSLSTPLRTIRRGRDGKTFWREDHLKDVGVNIAYTIPKNNRIEEFEKSIESFNYDSASKPYPPKRK